MHKIVVPISVLLLFGFAVCFSLMWVLADHIGNRNY